MMSLGAVTESPVIAILRQTGEDRMTISFTFWDGRRALIPLQLSKSPSNPEVTVLSGSVQFVEEGERRYGPDVRLLAFHGYFLESGAGNGKIVVLASNSKGRSETDFGMRSLKKLNDEAKEATNAEQAGTEQPATSPESKSEGGDKPQPKLEGLSR